MYCCSHALFLKHGSSGEVLAPNNEKATCQPAARRRDRRRGIDREAAAASCGHSLASLAASIGKFRPRSGGDGRVLCRQYLNFR